MTPRSPESQLRLGTRASRLALWQTEHIANRLVVAWPDLKCDVRRLATSGDGALEVPLPEFGVKGIFTAELEKALFDGGVDAAVHSLKDLPVEPCPGLTIGAIVGRADARDVLITCGDGVLESLSPGAKIGTCSPRRRAQLLAQRPDLDIRPIRGNVESRVRKVGKGRFDAIVVAAAGVVRLGLEAHVSEWFPIGVMLPAPGQGALAVQCRADDSATLALLGAIHDDEIAARVTAERVFLRLLDGGCAVPVAAYAQFVDNRLRLEGMVFSPDGRTSIRVSAEGGGDPEAVGGNAAAAALRQGAASLLKAG